MYFIFIYAIWPQAEIMIIALFFRSCEQLSACIEIGREKWLYTWWLASFLKPDIGKWEAVKCIKGLRLLLSFIAKLSRLLIYRRVINRVSLRHACTGIQNIMYRGCTYVNDNIARGESNINISEICTGASYKVSCFKGDKLMLIWMRGVNLDRH